MFFGEFDHSLDAKGRVILPAEFRDRLEDGGYITKVDRCLAIFPEDEFKEVALRAKETARLGPKERNAARLFAAGTRRIQPDRQGRVAIPANLRAFAGLEREVKINGSINRIELWDPARWADVDREGEDLRDEHRPGLDGLGI